METTFLALPNVNVNTDGNYQLDTLDHHALTCKIGSYVNTRQNTDHNTTLAFTRHARITVYKEKGSHAQTEPALYHTFWRS
jgi:hypothetical protein